MGQLRRPYRREHPTRFVTFGFTLNAQHVRQRGRDGLFTLTRLRSWNKNSTVLKIDLIITDRYNFTVSHSRIQTKGDE
ncbi:hypothetical protein SPHINGO361_150001 [Sphingomonas sp. EC-HK361]|nr:hypothetical protein SPHINGO361_150001 [Sphingomonas sp. EC-HK361]